MSGGLAANYEWRITTGPTGKLGLAPTSLAVAASSASSRSLPPDGSAGILAFRFGGRIARRPTWPGLTAGQPLGARVRGGEQPHQGAVGPGHPPPGHPPLTPPPRPRRGRPPRPPRGHAAP